MKVTLLSAASAEYLALAEITNPSKIAYCKRHGHKLELRRLLNPQVYGQWGERVQQMAEIVNRGDGWLFQIDADAIITNLQTPLPIDDSHDLFICGDAQGPINNGVFAMRCNDASREFLRQVLSAKHAANDQIAMVEVLKVMPDYRVKFLPQSQLNAYDYAAQGVPGWADKSWRPGDFVFHTPGLPMAKRIELLNAKRAP